MSVLVPLVYDEKRVSDDTLYDVDFSGWRELVGQTGATPTVVAVSGSGLAIVSVAYTHALRRAQLRLAAGTAGVTYRLKVTLTSVPDGFVQVEEVWVPVVADPV